MSVMVKYGGLILILVLIAGLGVGYALGFFQGFNSVPTSSTLLVDAAGTLQVPFNAIANTLIRPQYPTLSYNYIFEGSRLAANEITQANKSFDIFASADYRIIPNQLIPKYASWYIVFASNSMAVLYTNHSRYESEITQKNWYQIITRPGVIVGVSDKETDPSGYNAIFMLKLAGLQDYQNSSYLYDQIYHTKNAAKELVIVPTETYLDAQLETGAVDYVLSYSSEAISHKLQYVDPGPQVNLSNLTFANWYAKVNVTVNGKQVTGAPILYDVTIPSSSPDRSMSIIFIKALLSPMGQQILRTSGLTPLNPVYIYNQQAVPTSVIDVINQNGISIQAIDESGAPTQQTTT
ncbi:MAG: extracellular solute-binding protein [Candidatus Bathyarchaeia archaeon]|jgi:molybdate/tungstate transport system substrate-binding protein